jgi:hypothetical protein
MPGRARLDRRGTRLFKSCNLGGKVALARALDAHLLVDARQFIADCLPGSLPGGGVYSVIAAGNLRRIGITEAHDAFAFDLERIEASGDALTLLDQSRNLGLEVGVDRGLSVAGASRVSTEAIASSPSATASTRTDAGSSAAGNPLTNSVEAPCGTATTANRVTAAPSG